MIIRTNLEKTLSKYCNINGDINNDSFRRVTAIVLKKQRQQ